MEIDSQPLKCDYCGIETTDPWHGSGVINGVMSRHIHACDDCLHKLPHHPFVDVTKSSKPLVITDAMREIGIEYLSNIPRIRNTFEPHQIKAIAENLFSLMAQKM